MTWWRRTRRRKHPDAEKLDAAIREADRALVDARQLRSRADAVGDRLSETRRANHVAAAVTLAIRGA